MVRIGLIVTLIIVGQLAYGQFGVANKLVPPESIKSKMDEWFVDAKVGIFIHWGIYAADGTVESWPMREGVQEAQTYMDQANRFNPDRYDPEAWADIFHDFGAKYVVITTKHHDGVALWDTKQPDGLSVVNHTPYGEDILAPLFVALERRGIKKGAYFSNPDWSFRDYPRYTKDSTRYDPKVDPERWDRYMQFYNGQLAELMENYKPDLLWFDMPEFDAATMRAEATRSMLLDYNSSLIINSRLPEHGDYNNPEQDLFARGLNDTYWEFAIPLTEGFWGYRAGTTWATDPKHLIPVFARVIAQGGNFLFNIGPDGRGDIIPAQMSCLQQIGKWIGKHKEAIYGSRKGIGFDVCGFPTTYSKDSTELFVFVPAGNRIVHINGINTKVEATIVGSETPVAPQSNGIPQSYGWFTFEIPEEETDEYMTVLRLKGLKPIGERTRTGYIE